MLTRWCPLDHTIRIQFGSIASILSIPLSNCIPGFICKEWEGFVPWMWHLGGQIWSNELSFRVPGTNLVGDTKMGWGLDCMKWLSSAAKREVKDHLYSTFFMGDIHGEDGVRFFTAKGQVGTITGVTKGKFPKWVWADLGRGCGISISSTRSQGAEPGLTLRLAMQGKSQHSLLS